MTIAAFLLGLMTYWVPPKEHELPRYKSIVVDAMTVSYEGEILDGLSPVEQAVVILSVASFESRYSEAMDTGRKRGDKGESVCLGSIRVRHDRALREYIAHDRKECFRRILARVKFSWDKCQRFEFEDRLSMYIKGSCERRHRYSRLYSNRILDAFDGLAEWTESTIQL